MNFDWADTHIGLLITNVITFLFGGGSFYGFLTERSKRKSENKQAEASALESMQRVYDKFSKDALDKYETLKQEINECKIEIKDLRKKSFDDQQEVYKCRGLISELEQKVRKGAEDYKTLKLAYDILGKEYRTIRAKFEKRMKKI